MNAPFVAGFNPHLAPADAVAASWLAEATLRLRRELAWRWHLSGVRPHDDGLPPSDDVVLDSIDRLRHHDARTAFFASDVAAVYLGEQIALAAARRAVDTSSGWQRMARAAGLDEAAQFVLALALAARTDAAFGPVAAACQHDSTRSAASLALAQRLWDAPLAVLPCAGAAHPLFAFGLLRARSGPEGIDWQQALDLPAPVAAALLDPKAAWPSALRALSGPAPDDAPEPEQAAALAWLRALPPRAIQIVPLVLPFGSDPSPQAHRLAKATGRTIAALAPEIGADHAALPGLACAAWLHGVDLLLPEHWHTHPGGLALDQALLPLASLPLRWLLPVVDLGAVRALPNGWLAPALHVRPLGTLERQQRLAEALPAALTPTATEAARRFRLNDRALAQVTTTLQSLDAAQPATVHALCRAAAVVDVGQLAQPVTPRFKLSELVLPPRQHHQVLAIAAGMRALARVHHEWGTAQAWNEGGVAVLFCGPPGTGKTMCAEALATELELPMLRIDLSQVVNKYIGETEKNLRRIFDAAEAADCLLFFDEADALFGKRTEVKDAHDRFANIEVSYLLERMERFKGLAVLATNRRKDLDEAFARRLRFVIEFPLPGPAEREAIWRAMFPPGVDVSGIDFGFVAQRFEITGGPIRSAAFNACLHAAETEGPPAVAMPHVLMALKRELEKAGRETQREQFAHYAHLLPEHA